MQPSRFSVCDRCAADARKYGHDDVVAKNEQSRDGSEGLRFHDVASGPT
jgi:hypothetical protein